MPKTAIDYSKIQIYKLIHNDDINNENIYIGSTTNFVKRKCCHKSNSTNEKGKYYNLKVYENIRNNGGWIEWKMLLVEKYKCIDKNEANVRERYWIDFYKSQLNTCIPGRTKKEYKNVNKKEINEKQKIYDQNHKENKKENSKIYNEKNKIKIAERKRLQYEKKAEQMKEKIQCECGCFIRKTHLLRHQKTESHKILMLKKNINN